MTNSILHPHTEGEDFDQNLLHQTVLECKEITKTFGPVVANDKVYLDLKYGEILALLGENGSGKTTLVNMLSGIYRPDSGSITIHSITIHDNEVFINSPADAISLGIGTIHQHFKLVEAMTAFDNILLGVSRKKGISLDTLRKNAMDICNTYGLQVDLDKHIYDMSVGEKQMVEVLRVLYRGARILILDEPTAVLTPQEIESLFVILRRMRQEGCAIMIITHKLHEVLEISDRVTILRKGKSIDTVQTRKTNQQFLTETMVGHPIDLAIHRPEIPEDQKKIALEVEHLTVEKSDGTIGLYDASFQLKSGEILGVAGIAGSGQKELSEAIVGLVPAKTGSICYEGEDIVGMETYDIYSKGISLAFVPEDRLGMGLVGSMGMTDNMMLKTYKDAKGPFVDKEPSRQLATRLVEKLEISTPSIETPVRRLSGGNVQKVLLGREIDSNPSVLITAYPVRGLDIHSSYGIYDLLNEQKEKGCAILFTGEDLDVLLQLCDRILVLCGGKITAIVDAKTANKEELGLYMMGQSQEEVS